MYLYHNLRMAIHTFEDQGSLGLWGDIFGIWSVYLNLRMATHLGVIFLYLRMAIHNIVSIPIPENGDIPQEHISIS